MIVHLSTLFVILGVLFPVIPFLQFQSVRYNHHYIKFLKGIALPVFLFVGLTWFDLVKYEYNFYLTNTVMNVDTILFFLINLYLAADRIIHLYQYRTLEGIPGRFGFYYQSGIVMLSIEILSFIFFITYGVAIENGLVQIFLFFLPGIYYFVSVMFEFFRNFSRNNGEDENDDFKAHREIASVLFFIYEFISSILMGISFDNNLEKRTQFENSLISLSYLIRCIQCKCGLLYYTQKEIWNTPIAIEPSISEIQFNTTKEHDEITFLEEC